MFIELLRSQKGLLVVISLIVASAVIAACGGGGSSMGGPTPPPSPTPTGTPCAASVAERPLSATRGAAGLIVRLPQRAGTGVVPGMLAVRFREATHPAADTELSTMRARMRVPANAQGFVMYAIPAEQDPIAAAARLRSVRGVEDASAIHYRYLSATPIPTLMPNDPHLGTPADIKVGGDTTTPVQWDMFKTQMPEAWAITTGSSAIKIAIIDTGYDMANPDLSTKVDASVVFLTNACAGATAQDHDGHGSNVSGIAAADTNNNSLVAGVGWQTHLVEARVFAYPVGTASPSANTADIANAVNWAVMTEHAKVINLSLGGTCPDDPVEQAAIESAITAGTTVVAAAGNDGSGTMLNCPAADPGVIAVGATSLHDSGSVTEAIASFSDWGSNAAEPGSNSLDVVAPGGDPTTNMDPDFLHWILGLYSQTAPCTPPGCPAVEALFAGTSQATPHVSGLAALMYAKDPAITPAVIKTIFDNAANNDDIGAGVKQGHGRINAFKALNAVP